jgi:hypothetical protein
VETYFAQVLLNLMRDGDEGLRVKLDNTTRFSVLRYFCARVRVTVELQNVGSVGLDRDMVLRQSRCAEKVDHWFLLSGDRPSIWGA